MDDNAWIPPHRVLGIADDADAIAIRKAYALKLKTVRPDTDPLAFQQLVEARDQMLRWVGLPRVVFDDDDDETDDAPRVVVDAAPRPAVVTDPSAVIAAPIEGERMIVTEPSVGPVPVEVAALATADDQDGHDIEPAVSSQDVLDLLDDGLAVETPLDREQLEAVLAQLPAGALRWSESDAIDLLAAAARRFEREAYPNAVREAYDIAFVRLADIFDWEARDRTIHQTLTRDDAHVFFIVLGRALRRHVPGYAGRYARPRPVAAVIEEPQRWFSWRSAWTWGVVIMIVVQFARCVGEQRPAISPVQKALRAAWLLDVDGRRCDAPRDRQAGALMSRYRPCLPPS